MKTSLKYFRNVAAAIVILVFASSCSHSINFGDGIDGEGKWTSDTRNITEDFNKIEVNHGIKLIITQSESNSITVNTDSNLQSVIKTSVENGTLIITADEAFNSTNTTVVEVSLPEISSLKASGGSEIESTSKLISKDLVIESSSGSSIDLPLEVENLIAKSSSGSTLELNGKAINVDVSASSGSSMECEDLIANNVKAQSSSGSNIDVHPVLALVATASSGSSVNYVNMPKKLDNVTSSGGSVGKK